MTNKQLQQNIQNRADLVTYGMFTETIDTRVASCLKRGWSVSLIVGSYLSDAQEMLELEVNPTRAIQYINIAKYVLFTYGDEE